MFVEMISDAISSALRAQGLTAQLTIGVHDLENAFPLLKTMFPDDAVMEISTPVDVLRLARSRRIVAILSSVRGLTKVVTALGIESAEIGIVGVGSTTGVPMRAGAAIGILPELSAEALAPLLKRAFEFRALRALELLHRCEARRLLRREMELIGFPPEQLSDDVASFQPPPLPVGVASVFDLEILGEAFERAYIDRVQLLCESAREAARHLDVSAATLARRLRREGSSDLEQGVV